VQIMLDGRVAAFRRRGVALPPPIIVADSWFGDSKLMRHMATIHEGTLLVEGKSTYVFTLADGRQVKGEDLQHQRAWPWRDSPQIPGVRYVRLRATSPTYACIWVSSQHQCATVYSGRVKRLMLFWLRQKAARIFIERRSR
jgi:hypothetical protein